MSDAVDAKIVCPNCGRKYKWSAEMAGKKVKCKCEAVIRIPLDAASSALVVPAKPAGSAAAPVASKPAPATAKPAAAPAKATAAPPLAMAPASGDDYELDLPDDLKQPAKPAPAAPAAAKPAAPVKAAAAPAKPAKPGKSAAAPPAAPSLTAAMAPTNDTLELADGNTCPSCKKTVKPEAVICINCGFNLKEGKKIETETGGAVRAVTGDRSSGGSSPRRRVYDGYTDGIFGRISRSWEYAKLSYGILWDFKQLIVFPLFSMTASLAVLASFLLPLWTTGTLGDFAKMMDEGAGDQVPVWMYFVAFLFYFCSYFVIVFFNTALIACTMKVLNGEAPTLGYGLKIAVKRIPQIAAWALISAIVGVILKAIENFHEKLGKLISAILGTAWTVLTYFVVPVLAVDGVGPVAAIKQSVATLRSSWGEGVLGNFSLGLLTFLISLPVYLIFGGLIFLGITSQSALMVGAGVFGFVVGLIIVTAASSAADTIFKALLFNYATGRSLPAEVDESIFPAAFAPTPRKE